MKEKKKENHQHSSAGHKFADNEILILQPKPMACMDVYLDLKLGASFLYSFTGSDGWSLVAYVTSCLLLTLQQAFICSKSLQDRIR